MKTSLIVMIQSYFKDIADKKKKSLSTYFKEMHELIESTEILIEESIKNAFSETPTGILAKIVFIL